MSETNFEIVDITWSDETKPLPIIAVIGMSNHLTDRGYEDFEPDGFLDDVEELEDEEAENFWDSYEPSEEAMKAFDCEWAEEITRVLTKQFGVAPTGFGGYHPHVG